MPENRVVALVTCAGYADLHDDDRALFEPLVRRGITAVPAVWDDPTVDWGRFDLSVLRSTWDYAGRRDLFLAWAASLPAVVNPVDVLAWNTDKRYLADLAEARVPVVETAWLGPGDDVDLGGSGMVVIKPSVGAGSVEAGRYDLGSDPQRRLAVEHVRRLQDRGEIAMVQPYLHSVDDHGETALMFFGGAFSHAAGKAALLSGPYEGVEGLYVEETITPRTPTDAELDVAASALSAVPGGLDRLAYARVDVLPGPDGTPVLLELELCEPSLFFDQSDGAAERFAATIADVVTASAAVDSRT